MTKPYVVALPLLLLWLACWIALSWGAMQDDAFIHLRYADNLALHHFITYDGVHANYGASSLLYVSALAVLRGLTSSAELPRTASSVMHLLLFGGLFMLFARVALGSRLAGWLGLVMLVMLCTPSAVRWLDDGMETVVVLCLVSLLAWLIHRQRCHSQSSWPWYGLMVALSALAVLLRIELSLLCAVGCLILGLSDFAASRNLWQAGSLTRRRLILAILRSLPILIGSGVGAAAIVYTMHVLLPDTALAKSHGSAFWANPIHDTASTLASAFSFGLGLFLFWLLTLSLTLRWENRLTMVTVLANSLFPTLLAASVWRGQEIQGVRYFSWTFLFSIVWNILELGRQHADSAPDTVERPASLSVVRGFLGCVVLLLPAESVVMHRVLLHRQGTLRLFESQRLDVLQTRRGVAADIGFIGYFTKASLCDLAGLVNGRTAGKLTSHERVESCAATDPDFAFVNVSQLASIAPAMDFSGWQVCGSYDFTNVRSPDSHYLVVRPALAEEVCHATGRVPESLVRLLPPASVAVEGANDHGELKK